MWVENISHREKQSKAFVDSVDSSLRSVDVFCGLPIHYESALDSGVFDTEVDLDLEHITETTKFEDCWVVKGGWAKSAVGIPGGKTTDGWWGWRGRQGEAALWMRLVSVGWFRSSTLVFDNEGGAADYSSRGVQLSKEVQTVTVPTTAEEINVLIRGTWADIWSLGGGASIWLESEFSGWRMKLDIIVNKKAYDKIQLTAPPVEWDDPENIYFAFVFKIDPVEISKWKQLGFEVNLETTVIDDNDGPIEITNSNDDVLGYFPGDVAYIRDSDDERLDGTDVDLRKWFYKSGGAYYMIVGMLKSEFDAVSIDTDEDIVFDPSIDEQVGASSDDAHEDVSDGDMDLTALRIKTSTTQIGGTRWSSVTGPANGDTIDVATIDVLLYNASVDSPDVDIYFEDQDSPSTFTVANSDISTRTRTTNYVNWTDTDLALTWQTSPELKTVVQEIIDRGGWSSGNAMVAIWWNGQTSMWFRSQDQGNGAKLHIEYTAGGGLSIPVAMHHYRKLRA